MKIVKFSGSSPKIYVSGGWGYGNRGDNAILEGTLGSLKRHIPDAELILTSYSQEELEESQGLSSIPSVHALLGHSRFSRALMRFRVWLFEKSRGRLPAPRALQDHIATLRSADIVVMAGGGYFNDGWPEMLRAQYLMIRLASMVGTPIAICGQTIGAFAEKEATGGLRKHLELVDIVAVRDRQSYELAKLAAVPDAKLFLTADLANTLAIDPAEQSGNEKLTIGLMTKYFNVHMGKVGPSPKGRLDAASYVDQLVIMAETIARQRDVRFRFIPSTSWDERFQIRLMHRFAASGLDYEVVKNPTTAEYIKACQSIDVMISTNMHPTILASTATKPTIVLSYNFKLDDFMESIGLGEYVRRIDDFDGIEVAETVVSVLDDRTRVSELVARKTREIRVLAEENSKILAACFTRAD